MIKFYKLSYINSTEFVIIEENQGYQIYFFGEDGICKSDYWRDSFSEILTEMVQRNVINSFDELAAVKIQSDDSLEKLLK